MKRIVEAAQAVADRSGEAGQVKVHASAEAIVREGRAWLSGLEDRAWLTRLEDSDPGPAG